MPRQLCCHSHAIKVDSLRCVVQWHSVRPQGCAILSNSRMLCYPKSNPAPISHHPPSSPAPRAPFPSVEGPGLDVSRVDSHPVWTVSGSLPERCGLRVPPWGGVSGRPAPVHGRGTLLRVADMICVFTLPLKFLPFGCCGSSPVNVGGFLRGRVFSSAQVRWGAGVWVFTGPPLGCACGQ